MGSVKIMMTGVPSSLTASARIRLPFGSSLDSISASSNAEKTISSPSSLLSFFATFESSTGGYVSGHPNTSATRVTPEKIAGRMNAQRQLIRSAAKLEMMGPRLGPEKVATL